MEQEYIQSKTKVPLRTRWYSENKDTINAVCAKFEIEHRYLYHLILSKIGEMYNLEAAKIIYENELGYPPAYAIDIVGYFPELENMANEILSFMLTEM